EERDVQVRGYKVRLPLDLVLVASANPEDYTNRGRIITPLKDRFGAQIRTHYPTDVSTEIAIAEQEARPLGIGGRTVAVPEVLDQVVATVSQLARSSPHVNQRSGVSVRLTVANRETLLANAGRRALRLGENEVVPRVSDLDALISSTAGKVEVETLDEGRDEAVVAALLSAAVLTVFRQRVGTETVRDLVAAFEDGRVVHVGEDLPSSAYVDLLTRVPALREPVATLAGGDGSPGSVASAVEFLLEGLHLSKRLNKDSAGDGRAVYRSRS
ncbi:MAG: magnesium chelatase, partial [Actinomycetota bacterium]|nr:magnesium chelatase [Actinomycetota bacterium]